MKMINRPGPILLLSVLIAASVWLSRTQWVHPGYAYHTFNGSLGWGYEILANDSLLIRQETIPALSEKKGFPNRETAARSARLVIAKLKRGGFPTLSRKDIDVILPGKHK